jgi:hypothetical protein
MSIFSFDISCNLDFRAALSGDPGAYDLTGSFTGGGTLLFPLKPADIVVADFISGAGALSGFFSVAGGRIVAVIS